VTNNSESDSWEKGGKTTTEKKGNHIGFEEESREEGKNWRELRALTRPDRRSAIRNRKGHTTNTTNKGTHPLKNFEKVGLNK